MLWKSVSLNFHLIFPACVMSIVWRITWTKVSLRFLSRDYSLPLTALYLSIYVLSYTYLQHNKKNPCCRLFSHTLKHSCFLFSKLLQEHKDIFLDHFNFHLLLILQCLSAGALYIFSMFFFCATRVCILNRISTAKRTKSSPTIATTTTNIHIGLFNMIFKKQQ